MKAMSYCIIYLYGAVILNAANFHRKKIFQNEKKPHLDLILAYTEKCQPYQPSCFEGKGGKHLKKSILRGNVSIFRCLLCEILVFFSPFSYVKSWFGALKICSAGKDYQRLYAAVKSKKSKKFSKKVGPLNMSYCQVAVRIVSNDSH